MRRYAVPLIAGLAAFGFGACSPDEENFKDSAEDFIEDEDGDVATQTGITFAEAACDEPASTDEGSTFTCTATGSDGTSYIFTAEITGEREFTIQDFAPSEGGATPGTGATTATSTPTS